MDGFATAEADGDEGNVDGGRDAYPRTNLHLTFDPRLTDTGIQLLAAHELAGKRGYATNHGRRDSGIAYEKMSIRRAGYSY